MKDMDEHASRTGTWCRFTTHVRRRGRQRRDARSGASVSDRATRRLSWRVIAALGLLGAIAAASGIVLIWVFAFGRTFLVPSRAMNPTINTGRRVVTHTGSVHRGDVIVFTRPPGLDSPLHFFVSRVIAVGGDTVEGHDAAVWLNGHRLSEQYVNHQCHDAIAGEPFRRVRVPRPSLWVMGDNRCDATDSRFYGPVAASTVVGRVVVRNAYLVLALGLAIGGAAAIAFVVVLIAALRLSEGRRTAGPLADWVMQPPSTDAP